MENSLLSLDPEEFELAIEELGLTPEDQEFLRGEYKSANSVSGRVEEAFKPEEGRERSTFLPMTKPEGTSTMDALMSGQGQFALPGVITEGIQEAIEGVEAPAWAGSGLEGQGTLEDAWKTVGIAAGGSATATVPDDALRMFGGKRARGANYSAYVKAKQALNEGRNPEQVWQDTGWAMNRNGQLRFEISDDDFKYNGVPKSQEYYYLEDVANHPKLFDNYPELRGVRISEQLLEDDHFGFMDFDGNGEPYIVINNNMPASEKVDTILHELQHIVQNIEDPNFSNRYEQNRVAYGYYRQPEEVEAELPSERLKMSPEIRRMQKPEFAEGGVVEGTNMENNMTKLFAEGGVNTGRTEVDPVSGNEVPPGSLPEEVRDDIDAKLSGGEYVVPADVLRYYGVSFFEKLRKKAKEGLSEMDKEGRIGGEAEEDDDDLPFSDEELMVADEEDDMEFAQGGVVPFNPNSQMYGGQTLPVNSPIPLNPNPTGQTPSNPFTTPTSNSGSSSGGMETRTYENAQGQKMQILFINGQPGAPIPTGFFPEGTVPKQTTPTATTKPDKEGPKGGGAEERRNLGQTGREQGGNSGTGRTWDPGVDFSNSQAVSDYVSKELNQANTYGKVGGGLAQLALGPIGGLVGGVAAAGTQVSNARAASIIARAQGNTELADKLDKEIDDYVESKGLVGKAALNALATGELKAKRYLEAQRTGVTASGTTPPSLAGKSGGSAGGKTFTKDGDKSGGTGPKKGTISGPTGGSSQKKGSSPSTTGKTSSKPAPSKSTPSKSTGGEKASGRSGGRFGSGGLVERRKK